MARPLYKSGDLVSGAVLTGLGLYIISEARRWDYLAADGPGPGFFPMWYGVVLVALSIALVAGAVFRRATDGGAQTNWAEIGRALIAWLALAASIASLKLLGFLVSFAILTFFVVSIMYREPLVKGIAAGVGAALVFYLVFPLALNVALPQGALGF